MSSKRKYLTLGNILGETFKFYFINFIKFILPSFVIASPLVVFILRRMQIIEQITSLENNPILYFIGSLILYFLFIEIKFITTRMLSCSYIGKKEKISEMILDSLRSFFPFFGLLLITQLLVYIGAFFLLEDLFLPRIIGLLLSIIGIIIVLRWFVASEVFLIEKTKVKDSLKRSWILSKGYNIRIFLFFCLIVLIIFIFTFIISVIILIIIELIDIEKFSSADIDNDLSASIFFIICIQLFPLFTSFKTVVYYNLKKEKECFETEQLADSFLEEANHDSLG